MNVEPTRAALLIASWDYEDPAFRRLRTPANDIESLARVLADPNIGNFSVQVVTNESHHLLRESIQEFLDDRERDDLLLLYFGCHGVKNVDGRLYFVTSNTQRKRLESTGIESLFVSEQIDRSLSRRIILMLDCCYSGAFPAGMTARMAKAVDVKEQLEGRGRVVITASSAIEYAYEGDDLTLEEGQNSFFTGALVKGLSTGEADRDGDGWIDITELYEYVYENVRNRTPDQTPGILSRTQGRLLIARNPLRVKEPSSTPTPAQAIESGQLVAVIPDVLAGRYEVQQFIGSGRTSEVFRGRDRTLNRAVAVKILLPHYAQDTAFLSSLKQEAEFAASLTSANVVNIYDVGAEQNVAFIVMEYVAGRTLAEILRDEGVLLPLRAAEVASDVSTALATAHGRGLVHRSLNSENILITVDGTVKVKNFGFNPTETRESTSSGARSGGSASSIDPEPLGNGSIDSRADLYSLGCILYQMVTGSLPFGNSARVVPDIQDMSYEPTPPRFLNADVPPRLNEVILKAIAKEPNDRYHTAAELRRDLQEFLTDEFVRNSTPNATEASAPTSRDSTAKLASRPPREDDPSSSEPERASIGWIIVSLLALAVVGVGAFFITRMLTSDTPRLSGSGQIIPGGTQSDAGDKLPGMDGKAAGSVLFDIRVPSNDGRLLDIRVPSNDGRLLLDYPKGNFHAEGVRFDEVNVEEVRQGIQTVEVKGQAVITGSSEAVPFRLVVIPHKQDSGVRVIAQFYRKGADVDGGASPLYQASGDLSGGTVLIDR